LKLSTKQGLNILSYGREPEEIFKLESPSNEYDLNSIREELLLKVMKGWDQLNLNLRNTQKK
jgi:hypothetical protein